MASVSSISTISKVFSKLGDNSGSVVPMFAKDMASSGLTSYTYFKDGGKMDGAEKALEEFGTTVIWLGGIPLVKKIIDKTIYKKVGISPEIDAKRLFSNSKDKINTLEFARDKAKSLGEEFAEQASALGKAVDKKSLAKRLSVGKFAISTAAIGAALYGLITLKQKRTEKKVRENIQNKLAKETALKKSLQKTNVYNAFYGKKKDNNVNFKGLSSIGTFFMSNPVANTAIVDGVITTTRLTQARKGEKFEVGLREACQLLFIYGLAQPLQKGMEFIGKHVFKKPISLDYSALSSDALQKAIEQEKTMKGSSALLNQAKNLLKTSEQNGAEKVIDYIFNPENKEFAEILKRNKSVGTFKTKEGIEQLSLLSSINPNKVKGAAQKTVDIIENAASSKLDATKYLKQTKFLKGAAIIANIMISALLMGYLQPKLNLHLRKKLNNGDNTNPAIRNLENELQQKLMFEGKENKSQNV